MPQLASPAMPSCAERAYAVLGHRPGLAVLAVLARHAGEDVQQRQITQEAGLNVQTASVALRRLEDAGVVSGSIPRAQRRGQAVSWSLDNAALQAILDDLAQGLTS